MSQISAYLTVVDAIGGLLRTSLSAKYNLSRAYVPRFANYAFRICQIRCFCNF